MRVAILSPYSWTYPGGVTRHIEALAERFIDDGHHVRVLAPYDPPGRYSSVLHRGARPQEMQKPEYVVSLGRTLSLKANQAVSNVSITPYAYATALQELRTGNYDVVHVHEPLAPVSPWLITDQIGLPLVGTFHTYNENRISNGIATALGARRMLNRLHVRIAVSEAAAWTARRFFGGHYRIIPNGVLLDGERAALGALRPQSDKLKIVFVGQAVERKGLPVLLRAFEALREHIPTELTVIGPSEQELSPMMLDMRDVRVLGKVDDETKRTELEAGDVLCAPSLGGESFGMVLTEAFAAGTPVVASDIAGYRDVVRDGVDGVLVPRGDAQMLAEALRDLYEEPARRAQMARAAALGAERFAWPRIAAQVMEAYEDAIAVPEPATTLERAAVRIGARAADLKPRVPAQRLASLEPALTGPQRHSKALGVARRVGLATVSIGGAVLAFLALQKIGLTNIAKALITASPTLILLGLAIMCSAMVMRAFSWHAILKAALPRSRVRLADAAQGTFIGVLMSSTLPARLGEPSRALVVARRTGRPRENLPIVLGTVVSQTLLNIVALIVLGAVMFSSVDFFNGHQNALLAAAIAPLVLLIVVLVMPVDTARLSEQVALLASARTGRANPGRDGARPRRSDRVPLPTPRRDRGGRPDVGVGASVSVLLGAAGRARARQARRRPRRRGRRPVRGQHHRGSAGDAGEPRRVPGRVRRRAPHRLAHRLRRRRRLRRDPPGGRGHDRDPDGYAGAAQGGHVVARGQAARDAHDAGQAAGTPELTRLDHRRHGPGALVDESLKPWPSRARRRRRPRPRSPVPRR